MSKTSLRYYEISDLSFFESSEIGVLYRMMGLSGRNAIHMIRPNTLVTKERYTEKQLQEFIDNELNPDAVELLYKQR